MPGHLLRELLHGDLRLHRLQHPRERPQRGLRERMGGTAVRWKAGRGGGSDPRAQTVAWPKVTDVRPGK